MGYILFCLLNYQMEEERETDPVDAASLCRRFRRTASKCKRERNTTTWWSVTTSEAATEVGSTDVEGWCGRKKMNVWRVGRQYIWREFEGEGLRERSSPGKRDWSSVEIEGCDEMRKMNEHNLDGAKGQELERELQIKWEWNITIFLISTIYF